MIQTSLFDDPPKATARARRDDPETSHIAAEQIEAAGTASAHRDIIASYLRSNPGKTNAEIAEGSGLDYARVHKRMSELERMNLVIRGQQKKCPIHQRQMLTWYPK